MQKSYFLVATRRVEFVDRRGYAAGAQTGQNKYIRGLMMKYPLASNV